MSFRILVINPGSTSTKLAIFEDQHPVATETIPHDATTLARYVTLMDQLPMRLAIVKDFAVRYESSVRDFSAIACRGGMLHPLASGTYVVNNDMVDELQNRPVGIHASNLAACIGLALSEESGVPSYVVDPVVVDELREAQDPREDEGGDEEEPDPAALE